MTAGAPLRGPIFIAGIDASFNSPWANHVLASGLRNKTKARGRVFMPGRYLDARFRNLFQQRLGYGAASIWIFYQVAAQVCG